jgi:amino acid adenylation domain-containing protein
MLNLSRSQEIVWLHEEFFPDSRAYNFTAVFDLRGPLDETALRRGLTVALERHEGLRIELLPASFPPKQRINPHCEIRYHALDLAGEPDQDAVIDELCRQQHSEPFDTTRAPMVRWVLVRTGEDHHKLLHTEHHLVHDGLSFGLVVRDIFTTYRALTQGGRADLPTPRSYVEHVQAEAAACALPGHHREALAHWRSTLDGASFDLPLPGRADPGRIRDIPSGLQSRHLLEPQLAERLRSVARRDGHTPFSVLLSLFAELLYRISGRTDIVIGTAVGNRPPGFAETVGMFVNTIPLRLQRQASHSMLDRANDVTETLVRSLPHQSVPIQDLARELGMHSTNGLDNPLFRVTFSAHDMVIPNVEDLDLEVSIQEGYNTGTTRFDLDVVLIPDSRRTINTRNEPGGMLLIWEFATDLFDPPEIDALHAELIALLNTYLDEREQSVIDIPNVMARSAPASPSETGSRQFVAGRPSLSLSRGAVAAADPGVGQGPVEWFESWAAKTPDAPAVVSGSATWSYRELDAAAQQLTRSLRGLIAPGQLVGVCLGRSPELVACAIAVARIGAVYLPFGSAPGTGRLQSLIDDADIGCLIADGMTRLPSGWRVRTVAHPPGLRAGWRPREVAPRRTDAFYAVTTSGSTGKPKIVLVPEAALANLVRWACDHFTMGPGTRLSLIMGTTFDPHLKEVWSALSSGAALHVVPDEARASTAELFQWWQQSSITHCFLPTPLADLVFARPWPAGLALRHVTAGGDRMRVRPRADTTATVHNLYGPAEATVVTTAYQLNPAQAGSAADVPIGTPITGVAVFVTDEDGRLLPRGEAGELRIGGAGLAIGYLDSAATAERFVPASAEMAGVDRVYRTGDKVRMRLDGQIEFLGRLDDQVKISGVRIEPAEVEAALEAHPSVCRAVVVPVPGVTGALRLAAFLLLAGGAVQDAAAITRLARTRLPEQGVPNLLRFVDDYPLNANGKVDRAALAQQAAPAAANCPAAVTSAASETEAFLLATCRQMLDHPGLTLDVNFTDAGGTSLAAAQLLAAIEATYGIRVKAAEVIRQPDLRALAALVDTRRRLLTPSADQRSA